MELESDLGLFGSKVYTHSFVTHCHMGPPKEESVEIFHCNREMENMHTCIYVHGENAYIFVYIYMPMQCIGKETDHRQIHIK